MNKRTKKLKTYRVTYPSRIQIVNAENEDEALEIANFNVDQARLSDSFTDFSDENPIIEDITGKKDSQTIKIEVRGGVVTDVSNLPTGWDYEIKDYDINT